MAHVTTHEHLTRHKEGTHRTWFIREGLAAGFIAGIIFAIMEMGAAWITTGQPLNPLRMIASVPLQVPPAGIGAGSAIFVGGIFHALYSMAIGVLIAYIVARVSNIHRSKASILIFTSFVGFLLWIVNFYVIAQALDMPWFTTETNAFLQFIWHTVFFGTMLGYYLDEHPPKDEPLF